MPPDVAGLLEDILRSAQYITDDTSGMSYVTFEHDRRTQQLVERNFEIIGEAANRLRRHSPAIAERISGHKDIIDFRNLIIHGYDLLHYPRVWSIVQESLPVLRAEVEQLLREQDKEFT